MEAPPRIVSRWPIYAEDEIAAVTDVLRAGRVNSLHHGERCRKFEERFATLCDMPHAIAVANGTLALEVSLRALGIGPGDEVIVPARSFVASASCVVACAPAISSKTSANSRRSRVALLILIEMKTG